ncbi:MAG: ASKHA domain-containing protein [Acidimicrobiales bacterium]
MTESARVVFTPSGRQGTVARGTTVLDAARELGVDLDTVCGGRGICGRCQVVPEVGEFSKHGITSTRESVSAPGPSETTDYRGRRPLGSERHRLGCHAAIESDVVIDVPAESQVHRQVVRKRLEVDDIEVDPVIKLHYTKVVGQELDTPRSELDLLRDALATDWGLAGLIAPLAVVQEIQAILTKTREITVAVRDGSEIVAGWPGFHDRLYGVAIDVGSTTVAGHLLELSTGEALASGGRMNPQIRFGEDLMSRVSYVMMNPGGEVELTAAIREAIDELIGELADDAGVERADILEIVLVGNPIMHHLLLGLDAVPLGGAPFALATDGAIEARAPLLGINCRDITRVYVLPCIAGHVGADTAGAILSERPDRSDSIQLIVDVGTNAEIVLGNKDRLLAASSPTGPAFEGAQISSGQRATVGAIERVRIDRESLEPRFKVIGADAWSDEPEFAEQTRNITITGICGSAIIEVVAEMMLAGIISADGVVDGALATRTQRIVAEDRTFSYLVHHGEPDILVTQNDVRAIQLAKAALYAGVKLLMDRMGIDHVDTIRLAGAFGSHIDPIYAIALGLVPDCDLEQVSSAGNAAGTGAVIALLSGTARRDIETLIPTITKVETATEAKFQDHFVEAMAIPHATADYPHLSSHIELPARRFANAAAAGSSTAGRRRRRRPSPSSTGSESEVSS